MRSVTFSPVQIQNISIIFKAPSFNLSVMPLDIVQIEILIKYDIGELVFDLYFKFQRHVMTLRYTFQKSNEPP